LTKKAKNDKRRVLTFEPLCHICGGQCVTVFCATVYWGSKTLVINQVS